MIPECRRVVGFLPWFVGGDLDEARQEDVRQHLVDCASCRREAAGLQRATRALQRAAASAPRLDDEAFVAMHARIVGAVGDEAARLEHVADRLSWLRSLLAVAAIALVALGWWIGVDRSSVAVLRRPAMVTPAATNGAVKVVPYAGPRMQPLGDESEVGKEAEGVGRGLLGRDRLRPLVENELYLPERR